MQIFPLAQIGRTVEEHASALLAYAGANAEIPEVAVTPEKRITKTGEQRIGGRLDDRRFPFGPGAQISIAGSGEALNFAKIAVTIAQRGQLGSAFFHAGVDERCGAVIVDRASGEAAVSVIPARSRSESNWEMLPMNHVGADGVRPMHVAPDRGVRVVLEKHVVAAVPENGAVGIVHPILGGKQMKLRAKRIGGVAGLEVGGGA